MRLISKSNKEFSFLLCVIDINSKYAWVIPLKDKIGLLMILIKKKFLGNSTKKNFKIQFKKSLEMKK